MLIRDIDRPIGLRFIFCPSVCLSVCLVAGHCPMNPVDIRRDACDYAFTNTTTTPETVDTDDRPVVLLVFARQRTSTVTLHATPTLLFTSKLHIILIIITNMLDFVDYIKII